MPILDHPDAPILDIVLYKCPDTGPPMSNIGALVQVAKLMALMSNPCHYDVNLKSDEENTQILRHILLFLCVRVCHFYNKGDNFCSILYTRSNETHNYEVSVLVKIRIVFMARI